MLHTERNAPLRQQTVDKSDAHFEALDQLSVRPSDFRREPAEHAEAAAGRHLDDLESVGHNHTLLLVVGGRDALEALTFANVKKHAVE